MEARRLIASLLSFSLERLLHDYFGISLPPSQLFALAFKSSEEFLTMVVPVSLITAFVLVT
jgi:hypothetical protein